MRTERLVIINMKKILRNILTIFSLLLPLAFIAGCNEPDDPNTVKPGVAGAHMMRTVLLYSVASNNLYGSALDDMKEICEGASSVNLSEVSLLLYLVAPNEETAKLQELIKSDDHYEFITVKEYDRSTFSTDPRRLSEVIDEVKNYRPADKYGLILWSHGTGWTDEKVKHPVSAPQKRSFGMDKYNDMTDYMNLDELSDAIPSGMFDFIWFDACYMSGIETIYQLRGKCDTFVGYPTEVWSYGMPYNLTIPLILKPTPNLVGAADLFADYYKKKNEAYTIAVVRTSGLEKVASAARAVYTGTIAPPTSELILYSRSPCGPFYDFGQFTLGFTEAKNNSEYASNENDIPLEEAKEDFRKALDDVVLYKSASEYNFQYPGFGMLRDEWLIPAEDFSGINCHWFESISSPESFPAYYRLLDWYRDVLAP